LRRLSRLIQCATVLDKETIEAVRQYRELSPKFDRVQVDHGVLVKFLGDKIQRRTAHTLSMLLRGDFSELTHAELGALTRKPPRRTSAVYALTEENNPSIVSRTDALRELQRRREEKKKAWLAKTPSTARLREIFGRANVNLDEVDAFLAQVGKEIEA